MNTERITTLAYQAIDGFDATAHTLIDTYRTAGERLGVAARARWDAALKQSAAQLDAETKKNAQHARAVFGGYYTRHVQLVASGAEVAVDTVAQAARSAVERAAAWQAARA
jgi:hypothetical protein